MKMTLQPAYLGESYRAACAPSPLRTWRDINISAQLVGNFHHAYDQIARKSNGQWVGNLHVWNRQAMGAGG